MNPHKTHLRIIAKRAAAHVLIDALNAGLEELDDMKDSDLLRIEIRKIAARLFNQADKEEETLAKWYEPVTTPRYFKEPELTQEQKDTLADGEAWLKEMDEDYGE